MLEKSPQCGYNVKIWVIIIDKANFQQLFDETNNRQNKVSCQKKQGTQIFI
ncbi:MAG: hypothetical protein ACI828_002650 [Flavobacteriales bacterium]|jgi:hypothetical protein